MRQKLTPGAPDEVTIDRADRMLGILWAKGDVELARHDYEHIAAEIEAERRDAKRCGGGR